MPSELHVPYTVHWEKTQEGWKGTCAGIKIYGKSKAEVRKRLRQQLTRNVLAGRLEADLEPQEDGEKLYPAVPNPVSLTLKQLFRELGGVEAVAEVTGLDVSTLRRMTNPFYWGHSTKSIRRISNLTGSSIIIKFVPEAPHES